MGRSERTVLTVFIGSPGDLHEERKEARAVVERINRHVAKNLGVYVELRGWEDTLPGFSRPQEKINQDVRDSDLFIGAVWRRWGTATGEYSSGFEEEFELAKEQRKKGELEEIWLFFKKVPDEMLSDPGEQLRKVLDFRETLNAQREVLYRTFDSTEEWSKKLYDYLADYLTQEVSTQEGAQTGGVRENEQILVEDEDEDDLLRSLSAVSDAVSRDEIRQVDSFQSARIYLISLTLLYIKQHATQIIGTHENQVLYRYRRRVHLISAEQVYVLRNLAADDDGLIAGWFWIDKTPAELVDMFFAICSLDGLDNVKIGALRLLEHMDVDVEFERVRAIVDQSDSLVARTALEVYGQRAPLTAAENLEEFVEHKSSEVAEAAWRTVLAILARHDPKQAINWLRRPTPLRRGNLIDLMAPVWTNASKDSVRVLLEDESPLIRRKAFEIVKEDLTEDDVKRITGDADALMRAAAYMELVRRDVEVDETDLEENLKGVESRLTYSTGRVRQGDSSPPIYKLNDVLLELYKKAPYEDLEQGIGWFSTKGELKYEALADSYFEKFKATLRNDISQGFERLKNRFYIEELGTDPDISDELVYRFKKLDDYNFERFRWAAYRALAKHAEPSDIKFARSLLSDLRSELFEEELVQAAVEIMKEHGNADDVELLKPVLSGTYPDVSTEGAQLVLQLDPSNRSENAKHLLAMDNADVTRGVLKYSLENHGALSLEDARNLLLNAKEQVRLDALAFLARKLATKDLESLLDHYPTSQNYYYYNVVCWLDRILYATGDLRDVYVSELNQRFSSTRGQPS